MDLHENQGRTAEKMERNEFIMAVSWTLMLCFMGILFALFLAKCV